MSCENQSGKSRFVFILLALFLGLLGIHQFYIGHIFRGILHLLLLIFLGWTIVVPLIQAVSILFEIIFTTKDCDGNRLS